MAFFPLLSIRCLYSGNWYKYPKKAEETQQQEDDEYELIKYSLLLRNDCSLTDVVERSAFSKVISTWLADMSNLTESQKELNKKFLSIFKDFPHVIPIPAIQATNRQ